MDLPGIEPGAFRMQSECDTTTPQTHVESLSPKVFFKADLLLYSSIYYHLFVMSKWFHVMFRWYEGFYT